MTPPARSHLDPTPLDYQRLFEARGVSYDEAMRRWPRARDEEFGFVVDLARPRPGEHLVDVPAGGGYLVDHLPAGVEYLAVETAAPFAAGCRDRGLDVVEGGLDATDAPEEGADLVVSVAGLHHEADKDHLLSCWSRLLRPGGRLVIADVIADSAQATFLDDFVGRHNGTGHDGMFLDHGLADMAARAGLGEIRVADRSYHWWFDDEDALASYCEGLFGLRGPSRPEIVAAAAAGPGIDQVDGRSGLRWSLRGLVAQRR